MNKWLMGLGLAAFVLTSAVGLEGVTTHTVVANGSHMACCGSPVPPLPPPPPGGGDGFSVTPAAASTR